MSTSQVGHDTSLLVPPKAMLHDGSSSPEEFVLFGDSFLQHVLIPRAYLLPTAAVLDIGCGNGSVARSLTQYLTPPGRYEGIDVNPATVRWLQERYQPYPSFRFTHANVWNKAYNPGGTMKGGDYKFPFADGIFDLVLLKSVFTHMVPADVQNYLREISRVLRPNGRSVITYFLLNDESRDMIARGKSVHPLVHEYESDPLCRVADPNMPESVVGHDEGRIRAMSSAVGCPVTEITFGNWCGRNSQLGHQDLVIGLKS